MSKPKTGAMGDRFFCQGCQLERPIAMLVRITRYTKGKTIPMYRCSRCQNKERPLRQDRDDQV